MLLRCQIASNSQFFRQKYVKLIKHFLLQNILKKWPEGSTFEAFKSSIDVYCSAPISLVRQLARSVTHNMFIDKNTNQPFAQNKNYLLFLM